MFPILNFQQANPVLAGFGGTQELMKNALMNQYQGLLNKQQEVSNQYQPQTLAEQLQAMKTGNALSNIELQYAPQMTQAQLNQLRANTGLTNTQVKQMQFGLENPLLNQTGSAGQVGALLYMLQHPELFNQPGGKPSGQLAIQQIPPNLNGHISPIPQQNPNMSMIPGNAPVNPMQAFAVAQGQLPPRTQQTLQGQQGPPGQNLSDLPELMKQSLFAELNRKTAMADLTTQKASNYGFQILPVDQKRDLLAKAAGMGIDKNEAIQRFNNGQTIQDMAIDKGFDPNNLPEAIHAATQTDITRAHFRQQAVAEINAIQPILTEAVAPYSQMMYGFSPKQIAQAISGENPDAQAKFLAAKGLMPEMSSLRIKAMGGQVGIEAIREVQKASMGELRSFQGLVSPEVYRQAQHYMDQWINLGTKTANEIAFNTEKGQNKKVDNKYSKEDLEHTAKLRGITVEEVKKRLGIK